VRSCPLGINSSLHLACIIPFKLGQAELCRPNSSSIDFPFSSGGKTPLTNLSGSLIASVVSG